MSNDIYVHWRCYNLIEQLSGYLAVRCQNYEAQTTSYVIKLVDEALGHAPPLRRERDYIKSDYPWIEARLMIDASPSGILTARLDV